MKAHARGYKAYSALSVHVAAIAPPLALSGGEAAVAEGEAGHGFEKGERLACDYFISYCGAIRPLCNNYLHSTPAHLIADTSEHFASVCTSLAKLR